MNHLVYKNAHHNFLKPKTLTLKCSFCLTSTPKPKRDVLVSSSVTYNYSFFKKIKAKYLLFFLLINESLQFEECDSEGICVPNASMPGGLPIVRGRRPGVVLVPGVGASFLGVGVLDFRLGVDDLSF